MVSIGSEIKWVKNELNSTCIYGFCGGALRLYLGCGASLVNVLLALLCHMSSMQWSVSPLLEGRRITPYLARRALWKTSKNHIFLIRVLFFDVL